MQTRSKLVGLSCLTLSLVLLTSCVATPTQPDPPATHDIGVTDPEWPSYEVLDESEGGSVTTVLPEALPDEIEQTEVTSANLFKEAQALVDGDPVQAIFLLRQALLLDVNHHPAAILLADLLIEIGQPHEVPAVLRAFKDVQSFQRQLAVLQPSGSIYDLAMTAQEAIDHHPQQPEFLLVAIEAYLDIDEANQALSLWQRLPDNQKNQPPAQWLLGRIYQATDQPQLALQAFSQASTSDTRAAESLVSLQANVIPLAGWRYVLVSPWLSQFNASGEIFNPELGVFAHLNLKPGVSFTDAVHSFLAEHLPLDSDQVALLMAGKVEEPFTWIEYQLLSCNLVDQGLCFQVAPSAEFVDMIPSLAVAAIQVGQDVLLVSFEQLETSEAIKQLNLLARQSWLIQGE